MQLIYGFGLIKYSHFNCLFFFLNMFVVHFYQTNQRATLFSNYLTHWEWRQMSAKKLPNNSLTPIVLWPKSVLYLLLISATIQIVTNSLKLLGGAFS